MRPSDGAVMRKIPPPANSTRQAAYANALIAKANGDAPKKEPKPAEGEAPKASRKKATVTYQREVRLRTLETEDELVLLVKVCENGTCSVWVEGKTDERCSYSVDLTGDVMDEFVTAYQRARRELSKGGGV